MAKKDLAGLAALGALGYMMSKDKGSAVDVGESSDYTGGLDQGEDYGNEGRRSVRAPAAPAPRAASGANYGNEGRRPVREAPAAYETPYDRMNRKNAEAAQAKADTDAEVARLRGNYPAKGRGVIDTSRVNPNTLLPYKKGGSVSSASRRADGIATKGKTRGRYL